MPQLTLEAKERFLRNRKKTKKIILDIVRKEKGVILVGSESTNRQLPKHLQVTPGDIDLVVRENPKTLAKKIGLHLKYVRLVFVNGKQEDLDTVLTGGDTVFFLPPAIGGG